jgi:transcription initiation factor TFIIH subunit 2
LLFYSTIVFTHIDATNMADSDPEYDEAASNDDVDMSMNGTARSGRSQGQRLASRPRDRAQARWEAAASSNWELQEGADGSIEGVLGGLEEAGKRRRYGRLSIAGCTYADFCV